MQCRVFFWNEIKKQQVHKTHTPSGHETHPDGFGFLLALMNWATPFFCWIIKKKAQNNTGKESVAFCDRAQPVWRCFPVNLAYQMNRHRNRKWVFMRSYVISITATSHAVTSEKSAAVFFSGFDFSLIVLSVDIFKSASAFVRRRNLLKLLILAYLVPCSQYWNCWHPSWEWPRRTAWNEILRPIWTFSTQRIGKNDLLLKWFYF